MYTKERRNDGIDQIYTFFLSCCNDVQTRTDEVRMNNTIKSHLERKVRGREKKLQSMSAAMEG
jgi:hypothetical protein